MDDFKPPTLDDLSILRKGGATDVFRFEMDARSLEAEQAKCTCNMCRIHANIDIENAAMRALLEEVVAKSSVRRHDSVAHRERCEVCELDDRIRVLLGTAEAE